MNKLIQVILLNILIVFGAVSFTEAKTKSLQEVEGDRVIVLRIDGSKTRKLPKKFIKKKKAEKYIGPMEELKKKVTGNLYTGEDVVRHSKSPRYQNLSNGIIFNTGGGKIGYVNRKDTEYTIILDHTNGTKLDEVNEGRFDEYANVINDDCPIPHVFFDLEGNEAAIIFLPRQMLVYQYVTREGLIALKIFERD